MKALLHLTPLVLLLAQLAAAPAAGSKQKILFDCDLAGDVDDAFALALVLASPEFEVLGIVMDHGDTPGRARVACRMLYELGPELFTTRKAHVKVIEGGYTVIDESQPPNCEIGLTLQTEEFIRRMMDRLLKQNLMRPPAS